MTVKNLVEHNGLLNEPLYHGTSTLFLDSIIQNGIAAKDPVREWKILRLAEEIYPFCEKYLTDNHLFVKSGKVFFSMVNQECNTNGFNFQHGNTYISFSQVTAVNYAIRKKYGSELLTYTLEFLYELLQLDILEIKNTLYQKYMHLYHLLEMRPSPLLIKISNVNINSLKTEQNKDVTIQLETLANIYQDNTNVFEMMSQQKNFRLISGTNLKDIEVFLINVKNANIYFPEYSLHKIQL